MSSDIPFLRQINERDLAEIIKLTLERAVVAKQIPDYKLIKDKDNIVLSLENINPRLVPKIPKVNLIPLQRSEIQERADRKGDFLYLRFSRLRMEGSKVIVSLDNVWAMSKQTQFKYLSGGGFTIEYRKESGRWLSDMKREWIS